MQSNLRRYFLWQLRDFIRDRGYALLIVGFLLGFTVVGPVRGMGRTIDANFARTMLIMILTQVGFILPFITLNGIVSTDRKMGYYRFLFSKPVSIPAYYVQLFIVYFIGFLAATLILLGAFSIFAHPVNPFRPLLYCALVYLSLAGIAFLISSLFRYDWPILAGVFLGSAILHSMWQGYEGWRRMILAVLPPIYKLTGLIGPILNRGEVDTNDILWLLGYSAICFAAGLVVLQKRPFG
jgi:ABC-type transport system involved in multi-copper enzyme maturation permease subunit